MAANLKTSGLIPFALTCVLFAVILLSNAEIYLVRDPLPEASEAELDLALTSAVEHRPDLPAGSSVTLVRDGCLITIKLDYGPARCNSNNSSA